MANAHLLTGLGAAAALFLSSVGAIAGSVPSGIFAIHAKGIKCMIPIIQSGVLAIYGIIIGVILAQSMQIESLSEHQGYKNFSAGLSCGLACLASGVGMSRFVSHYMKLSLPPLESSNGYSSPPETQPLLNVTTGQPPQQFIVSIRFILVMVFLEAIGLYGLIVALFLQY